MTCRFQKVPVVFNKSLVDLENCTSFLKTTCDLLNSTCEIDPLKLLARHTEGTEIHKETAMKKQKEHDMVLKLQISCNKKEFYLFLTQCDDIPTR